VRATFVGGLAGLAVGLLAVAFIVVSLPPRAPRPSTSPPPIGSPSPTSGPADPSATPERTVGPGTPSDSPGVGLEVGDLAPPLKVARLGGGELDVAEYRRRPLWVNFMASYCPPCIDELPLLERAQAQLGDGIRIVLVDVGEDEATARAFVDSLGVTLPVGLDTDKATAEAWRAYALPVHFWLDGDGIIRGYVYGGAGPDQFNALLQTVLPGPTIAP
jgi:thiol-disulfide isomerase/thioredoxin